MVWYVPKQTSHQILCWFIALEDLFALELPVEIYADRLISCDSIWTLHKPIMLTSIRGIPGTGIVGEFI